MNTTRRGLLALGAAATVAISIPTTALAAARRFKVPALTGNEVLLSGCVVRFSDPDGSPILYFNGAHLAAGVESVRVNEDNGRLQVIQTVRGAAANPVVFAFAQTDETLAGRGIMVGASGGTEDTEYVFYDTRLDRPLDLSDPDDLMRMQGRNSNVWLGWVHAPLNMRR